jgi:hypothetical protein
MFTHFQDLLHTCTNPTPKMEPRRGIEPRTSPLPWERSTTELTRLMECFSAIQSRNNISSLISFSKHI